MPYVWIIVLLTTMSGAFMALVLSALCDEAATALAWFPLLLVPQVVYRLTMWLKPNGTVQILQEERVAASLPVVPERFDDKGLRVRGATSGS